MLKMSLVCDPLRSQFYNNDVLDNKNKMNKHLLRIKKKIKSFIKSCKIRKTRQYYIWEKKNKKMSKEETLMKRSQNTRRQILTTEKIKSLMTKTCKMSQKSVAQSSLVSIGT